MKKEKRILAVLKNKLVGGIIVKNRVRAFNNALEAARINAEMELSEAEEHAMAALKRLSDPDVKASEIVNSIRDFVVKRREINAALKELEEVDAFVNEDIELEEEKQ